MNEGEIKILLWLEQSLMVIVAMVRLSYLYSVLSHVFEAFG